MQSNLGTEFLASFAIYPSQCDVSLHLSLPAALAICQDIATQHAAEMGVDGDSLHRKSNAYWVVTRTKLRFLGRPTMLQQITAETWPSAPKGIRCDRSYRLSQGETTFIEGHSEWVMIDADTCKLQRIENTCYPGDLCYREDRVCTEPYCRFKDDFSQEEQVGQRVIRPTDIDFVHHMNNVAYARLLLDTFPTAFWVEHEPLEIELRFLCECHEGETVTVYRRHKENRFYFAIRTPQGETAVLAALLIK